MLVIVDGICSPVFIVDVKRSVVEVSPVEDNVEGGGESLLVDGRSEGPVLPIPVTGVDVNSVDVGCSLGIDDENALTKRKILFFSLLYLLVFSPSFLTIWSGHSRVGLDAAVWLPLKEVEVGIVDGPSRPSARIIRKPMLA